MSTKELVAALKERGYSTEGSEQLDQLRSVFVEGIKPEMRVRLHATSRYGTLINKADNQPLSYKDEAPTFLALLWCG